VLGQGFRISTATIRAIRSRRGWPVWCRLRGDSGLERGVAPRFSEVLHSQLGKAIARRGDPTWSVYADSPGRWKRGWGATCCHLSM